MRPTRIRFKPSMTQHGARLAPQEVEATPTHWGLCIHRAFSPTRERLGFFDVSDVETGALVAHGDYPGFEGAISALVAKAMGFHFYPGGICQALKEARVRFHEEARLRLTRFSTQSPIVVDTLDIAALTRGLNATRVHLTGGTDLMVAEDADWIASAVMERVGHRVHVS